MTNSEGLLLTWTEWRDFFSEGVPKQILSTTTKELEKVLLANTTRAGEKWYESQVKSKDVGAAKEELFSPEQIWQRWT